MRWYENPDLYWVIGCCLAGCSGVFAVLLFFGAVSVITGVANIFSTLALAITCYAISYRFKRTATDSDERNAKGSSQLH